MQSKTDSTDAVSNEPADRLSGLLDAPISKDWLVGCGFRVVEKPDRRQANQMTKLVRSLPGHLWVEVHYWEYPRSKNNTPDGVVISAATYGGGPLRIPSHVMETRGDLVQLLRCLSGVDVTSI